MELTHIMCEFHINEPLGYVYTMLDIKKAVTFWLQRSPKSNDLKCDLVHVYSKRVKNYTSVLE